MKSVITQESTPILNKDIPELFDIELKKNYPNFDIPGRVFTESASASVTEQILKQKFPFSE